jgi:hypothetical protein
MSPTSFASKFLRFIGIFFMALTVLFTLLGAAGTTCAAFAPENFGASMAPLIPYKWLYQLLIVVSVAAGIWGIRALVELVRGKPLAYRDAMLVLVVGGVAALVQVAASRVLRGKSMPTDFRLYVNLITFVLFLVFRIPQIWKGVNFYREQGGRTSTLAGGIAAIVIGLLTLTVQFWAGPTHTFGGINYADVWHSHLLIVTFGIISVGIALTVGAILPVSLHKMQQLPAWQRFHPQAENHTN